MRQIAVVTRFHRGFGRRRPDVTERFRRLDRDPGAAALLEAAHDPSPEVARRALSWLARSAGPAEVAELHAFVWTCDPALVVDVVQTLHALEDGDLLEDAAARLRAGTPAGRGRAARVLGRLGDGRAIPPLCEALRDRDASVRGEALDALSRFGADWRAAAVAEVLVSDDDADVRRRAIRAVARLSAQLPWVVCVSVADPAVGVRREVAGLAARLPREDVELLTSDPDREVRRIAVSSAGSGAIRVLTRVLSNEPASEVRLAAAQTLGRLGGPEAAAALITAAVDDDAAMVRAAALRGARMALPEVGLLDSLRGMLSGGARHRRPMALRTLAKIPSHLEQSDALQLARDPDAEVRLALAHVSSELLDDPHAILAILREDGDPTVAHAAYVHGRAGSR